MSSDRRTTIFQRLRRLLRVATWIVGVALLAIMAVLLLPPGRGFLLRTGIDLAAGTLPGELTVARAEWPRLGRLELAGVVWADGPDTLARIDTLHLAIDLSDLRHRDLTVHRLLVAGVIADVPAIQGRLPASTAPADTATASPLPFLRPGSLSPLPSVAVERLTLRRVIVTATTDRVVRLDSLIVSLDLRHDHEPALSIAVRGEPLPEFGVAWRLTASVGADTLALALAPLYLAEAAELPEPSALPLLGRLALPVAYLDSTLAGRPGWPALDLRRLIIEGEVGSWRLDAHLAGRGPGYVVARANLPEAPDALIEALMNAGANTLAPGLIDTLAARWAHHLEPGFELRVDLEPPPRNRSLLAGRATVRGNLRLPALSALVPLLPPQLDVEDLGPILADVDLRYDGQVQPPHFSANLDLGATDWLDTARLVVSGDTTSVRLDSLVVRLPGLALSVAGVADRDSVRATLDLDLPDGSLLRRWQDPTLADVELAATMHLTAAGAWPLPHVELATDLSLTMPRLSIAHLSLAATADADTVLVALSLPNGLQGPSRSLDSMSFDFAGAAADSLRELRGAFRLDVRAPRAGVLLVGRLQAENLLTTPSGTLTGDTLAVDLDGRGLTNPGPWQIAFDAADSSLALTGFELGGPLGHLGLEAAASPDSLAADISLALRIAMDALAAVVPQTSLTFLPTGTITADGNLEIAGSPSAPWAGGRLRLAFSDNPDLGGLSVETHLSLGSGGESPPGLDPGRAGWRQHSARLDLSLRDADTVLTHISALVPLPHADAQPDSVDIRLEADSMDLARLQPLLPGGITVTGRLDADPQLTGLMTPGDTAPDLDLAGGLRLTDLKLKAPDGSWVAMAGAVSLDGTSLAPVVRGGLDIGPGLIRLPEPPPTLLPATGEALLWEESAPAPDSLAVAAADSTENPLEPRPSIIPDLVFNIRCPGGLWLRGQGLDVELEGELALHLRNGRPAVEGELEARQGTMKQLGRVFKLERGRVIFYADESELNPELDFALSVRVGQYDLTIALSGTANDPLLEFSSSPDLSDGDIISVLLFGKTGDELTEGQSGLMAERAGQMAMAYGSVRLQESLARELGVDVLTIAPREGDGDASALTVGKYLNPKTMVRYEQVLDQDSAFFVHLDYNLTTSQEWKLHSQVSQGEASGIEIRWEKDW